MRWLVRIATRLCNRLSAPKLVDMLRDEMRAELDGQSRAASERLRDPYFMDGHTGRHAAKDELLALSHLRSIDIEPQSGEEPLFYLQRLTSAVLAARDRFAVQEDDPEGFGIGTFDEMLTWLGGKQVPARAGQ